MMSPEEHEAQLQEFIANMKIEGIDQAKLSVLVQGLRDNYAEVNNTLTERETKLSGFAETNEGLRSANMMLLSKLGTQNPEPKAPAKTEQPKEDILSLEDISKNFI